MADQKPSQAVGDLVTHEPELTLDEICETCDLSQRHIISYVAEGIISPRGSSQSKWRFSRIHLIETRRANRLERDLRLNAAGVALALELWDQIDELKRRLERHEKSD
jgi:chaperone modulatory protein CbpM